MIDLSDDKRETKEHVSKILALAEVLTQILGKNAVFKMHTSRSICDVTSKNIEFDFYGQMYYSNLDHADWDNKCKYMPDYIKSPELMMLNLKGSDSARYQNMLEMFPYVKLVDEEFDTDTRGSIMTFLGLFSRLLKNRKELFQTCLLYTSPSPRDS